MTDKFDPYRALDIARDATDEEINAAWRKAAKNTHPDVGGDPEAFRRASRAVTILKDVKRRRQYDTTGDADDTRDDSAADALTIIASLIEQMLLAEENPPTHLNLAKVMRDCVAAGRKEMVKQVTQLANGERRSARLLKRFTRKNPGDNVVQRLMADVTNNFAAQRGRAQLKVDAFDKADAILADYEFKPDKGDHNDRLALMMGRSFFLDTTHT